MLAALGDLATFQHGVEIGTQLGKRRVQPRAFLGNIVGDHVGDDDARLVQHHVPERDPVVE